MLDCKAGLEGLSCETFDLDWILAVLFEARVFASNLIIDDWISGLRSSQCIASASHIIAAKKIKYFIIYMLQNFYFVFQWKWYFLCL